ncbi:MAG: RNA polymerase sigma factor [Acidobacteriota bacterium]
MRTRAQIVDEYLVLGAQRGQVGAFERLAERWHPRLLRHARRLTGDAEGAQDAVQDTWLAIARGLIRLEDPARFGAWALRITSRRCADWISGRQRARQRLAESDRSSEPLAPAEPPEVRTAVREVLHRLDPAQRALLAMFYVEGLSVGEIAEALVVPVGTVKSRLYHARAQVRAALEV